MLPKLKVVYVYVIITSKTLQSTHEMPYEGTKNTIDRDYNILMNETILQFPAFRKPFILTINAINIALGDMLSQSRISSDLPIAYASRILIDNRGNI